jgi:anaerobic ribonucleoside-triphosphate reductase activating protein
MNYAGYDITLIEIPNEISLTILISGCPNRCPDCHSKFAWNKNFGKELNKNTFIEILNKYKKTITCVCFLGGEWDSNLVELIKISKNYNLRIGLYSGLNNISDIDKSITSNIDYLKIGEYCKAKGDLSSKNTNQKLYKILNGQFEDITEYMR